MPPPLRHRPLAALLLLACLAVPARAVSPALPAFEIEAPPALAAAAGEIRDAGEAALEPSVRLTGFDAERDGRLPIRVVLAPEGSPAGRSAPAWVAGFAQSGGGRGDVIVLFPARAGGYPDRGLLPLLRHETAHILLARVVRGRPVPRWFNEGLATAAGREWDLGDRARIALAVLRDDSLPIARLDRAFAGGESSVASAYALAGDLVRRLFADHGAESGARILRAMADGASFEEAFRAVAGQSVAQFESDYWRRRTLWDRWVPIVSSSVLLWGAISLLALAAFERRRARDRARLARWEAEEAAVPRSPFAADDEDLVN
ncbi:MAG: hypothetical protein AB7G12_14695 [Thermoanaerobaculia bacterium]